jgi:2-phosphosulfolactate phosphatase
MMRVDMALGPPEEPAEDLVVVDIFRSSTSIVTALENGAKEIIPCHSLGRARILRRRLGEEALLVGEKRGMTPKNFDLNISPSLLVRERVEGRRIVYCSTNLIRVVSRHMNDAKHLIIGGLVNASAVAKYLKKLGLDSITIIACGYIPDKLVSLEDVIGAGAIVSRLGEEDLSDTALLAKLAYENRDWRRLVLQSRTAKYLHNIGWGMDLELCLREDVSNIVPVLSGDVIRGVRVDE